MIEVLDAKRRGAATNYRKIARLENAIELVLVQNAGSVCIGHNYITRRGISANRERDRIESLPLHKRERHSVIFKRPVSVVAHQHRVGTEE